MSKVDDSQTLTSCLTRKGQATIPAEVRAMLGLRAGDRIAFVVTKGRVEVTPARSVAERTAGALKQYRRTPPPTPQEEREEFAQAVADEVGESLQR
jgi:AbrB family looped-hinge helix DNA binding protein